VTPSGRLQKKSRLRGGEAPRGGTILSAGIRGGTRSSGKKWLRRNADGKTFRLLGKPGLRGSRGEGRGKG